MAGFDKRVDSYEAALAGLTDNMTVIAGGFGLWALSREGLPWALAVIGALVLAGATAFVVERFT